LVQKPCRGVSAHLYVASVLIASLHSSARDEIAKARDVIGSAARNNQHTVDEIYSGFNTVVLVE
jgi:hypothetical protein